MKTLDEKKKWTMMLDPYDESTSPKEEGYYRIIDVYGNEMTDYFFAHPVITPRGIGYWKYCENLIIAWRNADEDAGRNIS